MEKRFKLFWLRENGCDAGIPVDESGLESSIRAKVLDLAKDDFGPITVRLPFMDRREWARRSETMRAVELGRGGDTISAVNPPIMTQVKNRAAELAALHPAWNAAPEERDPRHFAVWREVSVAVQQALRVWLPEIHLRDAARFEDRDSAYAFLVYAASRPCSGRPKTEFTYDVADADTLPEALRMTKHALREVLAQTENRLHQSNRPELARRYAPVWQEDIARAVLRHPRRLFEILGSEATLVNAVVQLGSAHSMTAVKPFAKTACSALRSVCGEDFRPLALRALQTATDTLEACCDVTTPRTCVSKA